MSADERRPTDSDLHHLQRYAMLGRLTRGIAHDYNNILVGISGSASVLRSLVGKSPELLEFIELIEISAERAAELTRQIHALSDADRGRFVQVDLNRIVRDATRLASPCLESGIRLRPSLTSQLTAVDADPPLILQVILSLILMAAAQIPAASVLRIRTREIAPGSALLDGSVPGKGDSWVCLALESDPFASLSFAADSVDLPTDSSTLMRAIEMHGARIVQDGSALCLAIPACREAHPEAVSIDHDLEAAAGETILLVDDEPIVRRLGERILTHLGYHVILAEDGTHAIDIYQSQGDKIDLIIMDVVMPGMNGRQAHAKIHEADPNVRTLLCSGHDASSERNTVPPGVRGFLPKPYSIEALALAVSEALKG